MELAALEKELENRTPEEQDRLGALLALLRAKRDPSQKRELDRRLEDTEGWLTLDELRLKLSQD